MRNRGVWASVYFPTSGWCHSLPSSVVPRKVCADISAAPLRLSVLFWFLHFGRKLWKTPTVFNARLPRALEGRLAGL